jgi:hypothetical protein
MIVQHGLNCNMNAECTRLGIPAVNRLSPPDQMDQSISAHLPYNIESINFSRIPASEVAVPVATNM